MLEFLVNNIPGFCVGTIAGATVMYFVYHNNQKLMNETFDKAKAEFDKNEKELRAKVEESAFEDKIKALLVKWGVMK